MASNPVVLSPLMEEARNCYLNRRKHSKRIKKLTRKVVKEEAEGLSLRRIRSAPDGQQTEVLRVLAQRHIPPFLMELVMKKRIFNIGSIKKMAISPNGEKLELPSLSFMSEHCRKQEQELQQIVTENRQRFEETRRRAEVLTLTRRATTGMIAEPDAHSSTMSLDSLSHHTHDAPDYQSHSLSQQQQQPTTTHLNMLDFNEPIDAMESSHHQNIFMSMF